MTMLSLSGSWADAISLPVVTGGMPNSRSATSNASWLFSTASSSFKESKLLENPNKVKFRERRQRWGEGKEQCPSPCPQLPPLPHCPGRLSQEKMLTLSFSLRVGPNQIWAMIMCHCCLG